ncbi:MAG: carbonic anhydrase [Phycisphaerales bacterium]|nr:MAG: carbonic anhydrase [Phycisphaerales bacterium]
MKSHRLIRSFVVLAGSLGALAAFTGVAGCATERAGGAARLKSTMDASKQRAMTPDQGIARLAEGNRRFVRGESLQRDLPAQRASTASGQHPFAVVLSCIDSRTAPETVFDQGIGDVFSPRIAGNYANADILGSMEFATKVAGARLIVVLGHTECGAVKGACDDVRLGNLTTVIEAIRPAVESVDNVRGERNSGNKQFVLAATEANVRRTVTEIRANSEILRELERTGAIKVVGAMYDIGSGDVVFLR